MSATVLPQLAWLAAGPASSVSANSLQLPAVPVASITKRPGQSAEPYVVGEVALTAPPTSPRISCCAGWSRTSSVQRPDWDVAVSSGTIESPSSVQAVVQSEIVSRVESGKHRDSFLILVMGASLLECCDMATAISCLQQNHRRWCNFAIKK